MKTALDVGCGPYYQVFEKGVQVTRLDPRPGLGADITVPVLKHHEKYDIVYASHLLEHSPFVEILVCHLWDLTREELRIAVPNLEWAAEQIKHGIYDGAVQRCIYGISADMDIRWNSCDVHRRGFTFDSLHALLKEECVGAEYLDISYWRNSLWAVVGRFVRVESRLSNSSPPLLIESLSGGAPPAHQK